MSKRPPLSDASALALADTFKVLGDPTRIRILDALSRSELCVYDIASRVGLTESAVSHQLRLLRDSRIVRTRRNGRQIFYTLDDQHIVRLLSQGLEHVRGCANDRHLHRSASCTPNRPSRSRAWTAAKRSRCSSAGSRTWPGSRTFSADRRWASACTSNTTPPGCRRRRLRRRCGRHRHARVARTRGTDRRRRAVAEAPPGSRGRVRRRARGRLARGRAGRRPPGRHGSSRAAFAIALPIPAGPRVARHSSRIARHQHADGDCGERRDRRSGSWSEAATVVFLFAVAQMLETRTLDRARNAIRALMDLTPTDAIVRDAPGERSVDVDQIQPGAVIVIRPGDKIPLDGQVVAGPELREPGAGHRRVAAGGQGGGRRGLRRHDQRSRRARGASHPRCDVIRRSPGSFTSSSKPRPSALPPRRWSNGSRGVYTPAVIVLAIVDRRCSAADPVRPALTWHDSVYRAPRAAGRVVPVRAR